MAKILYDSHCHITDEAFDEERAAFYDELRSSDLRYINTIAEDLETSRKVVQACRELDFCYGAVGWHPHNVKDLTEEILAETLALYGEPKIQAVGEIGLDYHYDLSPRDVQRHWFARQVQEAVKLRAPIVIHDREANEDVLNILKDNGAFSKERKADFPLRPDGSPDARVLLHCYSGSAELAKQYVKLGATISIAGPVTYKNARRAIETVEQTDLLHLLIETDSPYLAPVPMRGRTNRPPYVEYTARKIAEIKGISYEEAAAQTLANACRFFDVERRGTLAGNVKRRGIGSTRR